MALALCTSALSLGFKGERLVGHNPPEKLPWRTMESLSFFQEPLEPAPVELESLEFVENTSLINFGVVSKLSTLYERKDDRVFEAVEDGPNPVQGERVSREGVVRLHDTRWLLSTLCVSAFTDCVGRA
jgi:hypothetical protein